jgi:nucleotide-binding universal stress UspA family protein
MMINNILCAIDRSPSSLQALGYAIALAKWQDARLSLLEVIEDAPPPGVTRAQKSDGVPTDTRTALEGDLQRVLTARRASDVKVKICMRKGNVVQEILAQANTSRADLVVMGSHGHGGVQGAVLGSVAESVLRLATCPVLTVRSGVRTTRRRRSPFGTILCPTDFSTAAKKAVAYARRLAQEAGATLTVLNAVEWPSGEAAGAAIIKAARARSVDLIVMGVSGRSALDVALPGSTAHHVIREGAWPVLTVRTGR